MKLVYATYTYGIAESESDEFRHGREQNFSFYPILNGLTPSWGAFSLLTCRSHENRMNTNDFCPLSCPLSCRVTSRPCDPPPPFMSCGVLNSAPVEYVPYLLALAFYRFDVM